MAAQRHEDFANALSESAGCFWHSQQPFNWQPGENFAQQAFPQWCVGFFRAGGLCLRVVPLHAALRVEPDVVGAGFGGALQFALHQLRQRGGVDDQSHFGVESGGARVEVERADEDAFLVDDEGFGVQAGDGAAGQAPVTQAFDGGVAFEFI